MAKNVFYSSEDKITNSRIYNQFLQIGLDDGWGKSDKKENFEIFMDIFFLTNSKPLGSTVLDVGCGTGDLAQFLFDKNIKEYVGVDIFKPAIEKAKDKFPDSTFLEGDFLKLKLRREFDFVFCSGALSTKLESDNYQIIQSWIPKMWSLAQKGVAFNFLVEDYSNPASLFLYDPVYVSGICKELHPKPHIKTRQTTAGWGNELEEMHIFLY